MPTSAFSIWPPSTLEVLADLTVGSEQLVGGGVAGLLLGVAGLIARRTKDTDEQRERITQLVLDHTLEREALASSEIDAARTEAVAERKRADRLAEQNAELREINAALRALVGERERDA